MKTLLSTFFLLFTLGLAAQSVEINWISLAEAEKRMAKEPKKLLIDVYTEWCGPCKMMNNSTFKDPATVQYINKYYYAVKFNAEGKEEITFNGKTFKNPNYDPAKATGRNGTHELTMAIAPVGGRIAYPTIVYMDEKFEILSPVQGMYSAEQIKPVLTFFAENVYKTQSWQDYSTSQK